MKPMILKPEIPHRCMIAMCTNRASNSISRTSAPAQASFLMCDDCLREAYKARFGQALDKAEAEKIISRNQWLEAAVGKLTAEIAESKVEQAKAAEPPAKTVPEAIKPPVRKR